MMVHMRPCTHSSWSLPVILPSPGYFEAAPEVGMCMLKGRLVMHECHLHACRGKTQCSKQSQQGHQQQVALNDVFGEQSWLLLD